ncbi:hypothetical protein Tco_0808706 [Tanacetum coccineum]
MITSAPRTPNLEDTKGESSTQRKLMVIRFRLPPIRQDPKMPIPTPTEVDVNNLAKTIQISIVGSKILADLELMQNVEQNVDEDEFMDIIFNSQEDANTRTEPISDKESLEAEKDADMNVTNDDEGEESVGDEFELRRREKVHKIAKTIVPIYVAEGLLLERQKTQADVAAMIAKAIQKEHDNLRTEVISQVNDVIANHIPPHVYSFLRYYMSKKHLHVIQNLPKPTYVLTAQDLQHQLYLMMRDDEQLYHDDYQDDDAHPEGESSVKRQKTSKHGTYSLGESSSGQAMEQDPNPSGSGTQEQIDDIDAWMEDVGTDDDEVPDDKVSQELLEEM